MRLTINAGDVRYTDVFCGDCVAALGRPTTVDAADQFPQAETRYVGGVYAGDYCDTHFAQRFPDADRYPNRVGGLSDEEFEYYGSGC